MPTDLKELRADLFAMQDPVYRDFQSKLIPTVPKDRVIGVRVPRLRTYAKELVKTELARSFFSQLPHAYYEEDLLHAFLIEQIGDLSQTVAELNRFLPYVDNWAVCDSMSPKIF